MSQSLWGPMTNTMTSFGAPFLLQKKNSASQSPTIFYSGSYETATVRRLQDSFCNAALRRCQATTAKFSWFTGLCSPFHDLSYCILRNLAKHRQYCRQSTPTKEDGTDTLYSELSLSRGARQFLSTKQSLPGPNSGGETNATSTVLREQGLADVQVGGFEGQRPPEATPKRLKHPVRKANHSDRFLQFMGPEGTILHASCYLHRSPKPPIKLSTYPPDRSGDRRSQPIPPLLLAGTLATMLYIMLLSSRSQHTPQPWHVVRIFKGTYRRRPGRLHCRHTQSQHLPHNSSSRIGTCQQVHRALFLLVVFALLHQAVSAPTSLQGSTSLQTPSSIGTTNLLRRKHSFRRAQHQALGKGSATHRGRHMTAKQLGVEWLANKSKKAKAPSQSNPK